MIIKRISIRRVANGGAITVPLHEATFVDEDSIGVGLISDQYGLESVLKYSMERSLANFIRHLNGFEIVLILTSKRLHSVILYSVT